MPCPLQINWFTGPPPEGTVAYNCWDWDRRKIAARHPSSLAPLHKYFLTPAPILPGSLAPLLLLPINTDPIDHQVHML